MSATQATGAESGQVPISTPQGVMTGVEQSAAAQQAALRNAAFAADQANGTQQQVRTFTEDEVLRRIEQARQDEKAKLYPRLDKVDAIEAELATIRAERETAEAARVAAEAEAAKVVQAAEEEKMSAKELIQRTRDEFQQELARERADRERAEAVLDQERNLGVLRDHLTARLQEREMDILPEFVPYIQGNSLEEIDAAVEAAAQRTASVMQGLQQAQQQQRQGLRGVSPVGLSAMGPMETQQETRQLTAQQIKAMSPAEYARHRGSLLQHASNEFHQRNSR